MDASCTHCRKPLGRRRARQGVRVHPGCRRAALDVSSLTRALDDVQGVLERLEQCQRPLSRGAVAESAPAEERRARSGLEDEIRAARAEASALLGHLRRYKDYVQGSGRGARSVGLESLDPVAASLEAAHSKIRGALDLEFEAGSGPGDP